MELHLLLYVIFSVIKSVLLLLKLTVGRELIFLIHLEIYFKSSEFFPIKFKHKSIKVVKLFFLIPSSERYFKFF